MVLRDRDMRVQSLRPDGPAHAAGVRTGDKLLEVDDLQVQGQ